MRGQFGWEEKKIGNFSKREFCPNMIETSYWSDPPQSVFCLETKNRVSGWVHYLVYWESGNAHPAAA
jgi:hypothetical protein